MSVRVSLLDITPSGLLVVPGYSRPKPEKPPIVTDVLPARYQSGVRGEYKTILIPVSPFCTFRIGDTALMSRSAFPVLLSHTLTVARVVIKDDVAVDVCMPPVCIHPPPRRSPPTACAVQ